ncbi:S-layer homology domain-containing protein [Okeanomitos corallinicola TIOX110]|uniref:S-layer homology domain-containing protein n=1 Tax=Okeanomitos corallinicola TIOX110 TaxID=3133117 RepID=A0ABZ2UNY9_9CYAN
MILSKPPVLFFSIAVLISTLTACDNGSAAKNLEQSLAADTRLQSNPIVFGETKSQATPTPSLVSLPTNFPENIPKYPNAQLTEIETAKNSDNKTDSRILTRWQSADPSNAITDFYRSQFKNKNWEILQQPKDDTEGTFEVKNDNLFFKVSIKPKSVTNAKNNQPQTSTELLIEYTPINITKTESDLAKNPSVSPSINKSEFIGPNLPVNKVDNAANKEVNNDTEILKSIEFSDLNKVPPEWRKQIGDLGKLGVLSIATKPNNSVSMATNSQLFEPDKTITRREYARWLVAANNVMYANNPAKKIRLASTSTQPAFKDVLPQDADFPAIQGLAEAGLIPSSLSGDATAVLFRPDAPLTRENLLLWKVPLDTRQALPNANLEAVKQTWGFQDTEKIDPKALRAILADFQNAEQSNIRRVFGYTTLFQPKKAVNRAEAAAALSYFGLQSEGMSTTEALKLKGE